jgi:hypothetical protein
MENFKKLIADDKYQVFLLICPAIIPFSFAAHTWFVCVEENKISRYEVLHYKNSDKNYLHINSLPPFSGIGKFLFFPKNFLWKSKILWQTNGDENSLTKKIIAFIKKSPDNYPLTNKYFFPGPNSNTYVQWIINNFPELNIKLPWNCFGKNYHTNHRVKPIIF